MSLINAFIWGILSSTSAFVLGRPFIQKKRNLCCFVGFMGICGVIRGYYDKDLVSLILDNYPELIFYLG